MRVYLIRHAQSENNILTEETIHLRKTDPNLTALGYEQRDYLADFLKTAPEINNTKFDITHIYCSAMHRTMLTSEPVAKALGIQPQVWVDIHEKGGMFLREGGQDKGYPGMTRAEILDAFPNYDVPKDTVTDNGWYDAKMGIEPETHSFYRAIKVATALRERSESDDVLALVSHAGFMDILLKAIFNQLPSRPHTMKYYHYNTSITRIDYHGHRPILHYMNRVDHIPYDKRSV